MQIDMNFDQAYSNNYSIYIDNLPKLLFDKKVAIITNPKVSGLHLKSLLNLLEAKEVYVITVPDGEVYKNMDTINYILDRLFEHKLNRKSLLIAFGGGVIGDMVGFVASIFQRGVDFIQIPTTLLSQVDSSVGGKTGINNKYGKNLVGAFYQPKAVYIDISFLKTLQKREFGAGFAEIVKMAVIFDKDFFEFLEYADLSLDDNLKKVVKRSIELKAYVVEKDEKEAGIRASLNYGHTFCHVIENLTGYTMYLHGEAVSIGIVMANKLALHLGLLSENEAIKIKTLLQKYSLPTDYTIEDEEKFYEAFFLDKKSTDSKIKFILPNSIGGFRFKDNLDKSFVIDVLREFK